ncbi:MAG: hypothetical protein U0105_17310 [Candidatus Obscuribacterales bacterium]
MRRTAIALAAVALLALPAEAKDDDENTTTIMVPTKGRGMEMPFAGSRIKKMNLEFSGEYTIIRAETQPTLKQKIGRKVRAIRAGAKKVAGKARHAVQSTAETVGHGLKAAGHKVVVANEMLKPVTGVVSTVATWAGAWYFLKGRGVI